ncbi:hypothetical protein XENOCAPTIV_025799 [Xenoophorus captivus]|uniref:Uncharacterized protein n=1 Tax=Xenoophorus captivus TaxID=1517983 RepID=A0ABV0SBL5_9TELE
MDISLTAYNQTFQAPWVGTVELNEAGKWFDDFMLLALGGLAYQAFYQRILSSSSYTQAQVTCFASAAFCLVLGIPSILVGAVAASTDSPANPRCVTAQLDQEIINLKPHTGTGLTFLDSSVLVFWLVGVDMSYTIMFPQLVCVLFFKISNGYGVCVGYILGFVLRVLSGEPLLGLPPAIRFPGCRLDKEGKLTQFFPFRTTIMLMSLVSIVLFSWLASIIFSKGLLSDKWDLFDIKRKEAQTALPSDVKLSDSREEGPAAIQLLNTTSC